MKSSLSRILALCLCVGTSLAVFVACSSDEDPSAKKDSGDDDDDDDDTSDKADDDDDGDDTSKVDSGSPKECLDEPNQFENPTCGAVGNCGTDVAWGAGGTTIGSTGGTAGDGTYVLTAINDEIGEIDGYTLNWTLRLKAGKFEEVFGETNPEDGTSPPSRGSGTFAADGTKLSLTYDCPSAEPAPTSDAGDAGDAGATEPDNVATYDFGASSTELRFLLTDDEGAKFEYVFTKR